LSARERDVLSDSIAEGSYSVGGGGSLRGVMDANPAQVAAEARLEEST
jgi:hypothetical protein